MITLSNPKHLNPLDNQLLGAAAENQAAAYLKKKGYRILKQNYRYLKAEVDLIAQLGNTVVIVEVKARASDYFGRPESAVTPKKIKLLVLAANQFIQEYTAEVEVRFDIIAMTYSKRKWTLKHIEAAFYSFEG